MLHSPSPVPRAPRTALLALPVILALLLAALPALAATPAAATGADSAPAPLTAEPGAACGAAPAIRGLERPVRVVWDGFGVPHIYASRDLDAITMMGWLHARDRFFQMDVLRHTFHGRLAELVGQPALAQDVQLRTLGLGRAAQATIDTAPPDSLAWYRAYADGVNSWLSCAEPPPQYGLLELSGRSIEPWSPVDSAVIAKAFAFQLSFDLEDIDRTIALGTFQALGQALGFDGVALFSEDIYRTAPLDPTVTLPPGGQSAMGSSSALLSGAGQVSETTLNLARGYRDAAAGLPALRSAFTRSEHQTGSNWWMIAPENAARGAALLANDPHLGLDSPSIFYEVHLLSFDGDRRRPMIVSGVSFPGAPAIAQGCNAQICWGSTTNPLDVTDVYQEELILDPESGLPFATTFDGRPEPLRFVPQTFRANRIGDGALDNLAVVPVSDLEGGVTLLVPRRLDGPIVQVDLSNPSRVTGLSVQWAGSGATREVDAFRHWLRADSIGAFADALQLFDVGSQNWAVISRQGDIAYFSSGEMPLREDLQLRNAPDGLPPYFIRDGTGARQNEWLPATGPEADRTLPYEILPFAEMPQAVNPPEGFLLNANNDPVGTTLDNNPLNQLRPGGGLYYLSPGYADLRAGRIEDLIEEALAAGPVSADDLAAMQADHQLLDAQILRPFILEAFDNASAAGAPADLAALAADPRVAEAVSRLEAWRTSTPTGIPEGFDPGDDPSSLPQPSADEVAESVAATLYAAWRGQMIERVIDDVLAALGAADVAPGSTQAFRAMAHQLVAFDSLQGIGASGVDFFPIPAPTREAARDLTILGALRDALDLLASDEFAPAFGGSENLEDYRWGRLHRIVFDNVLGGPLSVPPAGLPNLGPGLPGVARSGGFGTVDAATHSARADGLDEFMFGSGPARRFVGAMGLAPGRRLEARQVIPGGQSGLPGTPNSLDQLLLWLVNDYHPFLLTPGEVQEAGVRQRVFQPAR